MKIDPSTWHARAYLRWCAEARSSYFTHHNLCLYVRVILFYWPLRWLFLSRSYWRNGAAWTCITGLANAVIYRFFGLRGLNLTWSAIGLVAAIVIGSASLVFGCFALSEWARKNKVWTAKANSFASVLNARLDAAHRHICPLIDFTKEEGDRRMQPAGEANDRS